MPQPPRRTGGDTISRASAHAEPFADRVQPGLPLRTEEERLAFCDAYFQAVGAPAVYVADGYREYELPRDVDKELTDRPYFWMWVEKTRQEVKPTVLRLAFNEAAQQRENERLRQLALAEQAAQAEQVPHAGPLPGWWFRPPTAELITLGCFRLDKICQSLDVRGRFACVRAALSREAGTSGEGGHSLARADTAGEPRADGNPWVPWLVANALVSYRCDLVEQVFVSVGCCLVNGQLIESFHRHVAHLRMIPESPRELLQGARLSVSQGLGLIRRRLEEMACRRSNDWAQAAGRRLQLELKQLHTYYRSILPDVPEDERPLVERERIRKERELMARMQPRIEISLRQLAIIGLAERHSRA